MTLVHHLTRQARVNRARVAILHGATTWATYGEWAARSAG